MKSSSPEETIKVLSDFSRQNELTIKKGTLPKRGREVVQLDIYKDDCVVATTDNFNEENVISVFFYPCGGVDYEDLKHRMIKYVMDHDDTSVNIKE